MATFKSEKSAAEIFLELEIANMSWKLFKTKMTIGDGEALIGGALKCLEKCTELRKSRDALHITISKLKRKREKN